MVIGPLLSVWPKMMQTLQRRTSLNSAHQRRRHVRGARQDGAEAAEVALWSIRVIEDRQDHCRHEEARFTPLCFDQLEHQAGIELLHEHEGAALGEGADLGHDVAGDVEHRHGIDPDPAIREFRAERDVAGGVDHAPMVKARPLRKARRARGILDLDGRVRRDLGQFAGRIGRRDEGVEIGHADRLAKLRQGGLDVLDEGAQVLAARRFGEHQSRSLGAPEHEVELARRIGGIDRYENEASEARRVLQDHPLGRVRGEESHALARLEVVEEGAGRPLRDLDELSIGPAPPLGRIGDAVDQRHPVGHFRRHLAEQVAERRLENVLRGVGRIVGLLVSPLL